MAPSISCARLKRVVRYAFCGFSAQVRRLDGMEVMEADRADAEQKYEEEVGISQLRLLWLLSLLLLLVLLVVVLVLLLLLLPPLLLMMVDAVYVGNILVFVRQRFPVGSCSGSQHTHGDPPT